MMARQPHNRRSKDNRQRAEATLHAERSTPPGAYAVVFVDDDGSPASVVATFPGPMSAEMYGKIIGSEFRVVRLDPAHDTP